MVIEKCYLCPCTFLLPMSLGCTNVNRALGPRPFTPEKDFLITPPQRPERSATRRLGRKLLNALRTSRVAKLLAAGGTVLTMLKAKGASAGETIANALGQAAGEAALEGDLPMEDYLENLKKGVEHISPTDPDFSTNRPHLVSQLNEAYRAISSDTSLEQEEKRRLLTKIREIQVAIPAPQLRPPPARERRRGGGSRLRD